MRAKAAIFAALRVSPRVSKLAIEEPIRKNGIVVRPDVRFCLDGREFVAVEFQRTSLDPREIERRTSNYFKLNVHVLWVASWPSKLAPDQRYQPRETEHYLHALYFGRLFMWCPGVGLRSLHFDDFMIEVEEKTYYDENGEEQTGGGYEYRSPHFVTPRVTTGLDLLSLKPIHRKAFSDKCRSLPEAKLLTLPKPRPGAVPG